MILTLPILELRSSRYSIRKEGNAVLKILWHFSLKNSYLPNWGRYHWVLFMKGSQDLILRVGWTGSLQFLPNWYSLFHKVGLKIAHFSRIKRENYTLPTCGFLEKYFAYLWFKNWHFTHLRLALFISHYPLWLKTRVHLYFCYLFMSLSSQKVKKNN